MHHDCTKNDKKSIKLKCNLCIWHAHERALITDVGGPPLKGTFFLGYVLLYTCHFDMAKNNS